MAEPLRVQTHSINIVAGDRMRPGDVLSVRVGQQLPGNRYRIHWNGQILTAETHLSLKEGSVLRARVEQGNTGLSLRLLQQDAGTTSPLRTAVPSSGTDGLPEPLSPRESLVRAFLASSLSLPPESVMRRLSALLGRTRGLRERIARLQALLYARGAEPSADFLEYLDSVLSPRDGRGDFRDGRGKRNWASPPDPESLRDEMRNLDDSGTDSGGLFSLMNQASRKDRDWLFHSSCHLMDDEELNLVWKIRRGVDGGLALAVQDGDRRMEFLLDGRNPVRMAVYAGQNSGVTPGKWNEFRDRLSLMNIAVDDTLQPMEASDGFAPGDSA